ncbi:rhamnan synthesis F family protein [Pontibacter sp. H249]|uniref:rhamnan synthesis F family protein n=1 Tax=Pontibacter sp. H249 TaxID=3133420 RepID=UPI0030BC4354
MNFRIAVFYHIFYEDSLDDVLQELAVFDGKEVYFFINICIDTPNNEFISKVLKEKLENCFITLSSNVGKDIGAKLNLVALYLRLDLDCDCFVFLHDKKSLQALKSNSWKRDLLKILSTESIEKISNHFSDNNCGIVAANKYILEEEFRNYQFEGSTNSVFLLELMGSFNINPPNYKYVAGTMFWVKVKPLLNFFNANCPLAIRASLEEGNVLDNYCGSRTHAWERLLSWIVTSQGYLIKGV